MIYLGWYLGVGFVVVPFVILGYLNRRDPESPVPMWAWFLFIAIWPAVLYFAAKEMLTANGKPSEESTDDTLDLLEGQAKKFAVAAEDLLKQFAVREIETQEMICDPLGAVPDLPFGHLYVVWRKFLDDSVETDEFWSFSKLDKSRMLWSGYAKVRNGTPIAHFVAARKLLGDE